MSRSVVDSFSFGSLVDIFSQFSQNLLASKRGKIFSVFAAAAASPNKGSQNSQVKAPMTVKIVGLIL